MSSIEQNSWRPIETAPQNDSIVDLWRGEWKQRAVNMVLVKYAPGNHFYAPASGFGGPTCVRDATHWMPIPEPPND